MNWNGVFADCGKTLGKAFGGSPLLQQGELDFSPAEKELLLKWALALGFSIASANARDRSRALPGALKRSFPQDCFACFDLCAGDLSLIHI